MPTTKMKIPIKVLSGSTDKEEGSALVVGI